MVIQDNTFCSTFSAVFCCLSYNSDHELFEVHFSCYTKSESTEKTVLTA